MKQNLVIVGIAAMASLGFMNFSSTNAHFTPPK